MVNTFGLSQPCRVCSGTGHVVTVLPDKIMVEHCHFCSGSSASQGSSAGDRWRKEYMAIPGEEEPIGDNTP